MRQIRVLGIAAIVVACVLPIIFVVGPPILANFANHYLADYFGPTPRSMGYITPPGDYIDNLLWRPNPWRVMTTSLVFLLIGVLFMHQDGKERLS